MNFDITLLTPAYLDTRFANYRLMNKYKVHMYTKGGVQLLKHRIHRIHNKREERTSYIMAYDCSYIIF